MNIFGIKNHIRFEKIFAEARINGKISWLKISATNNLPEDFIEQYFSKLKMYGIEKNQKLSADLINRHKNELNWYSILKYQELSEDCIKENIPIIDKMNLWSLLLKTQNLSLVFLIDHIDKVGEGQNFNSLLKNAYIKDEDKKHIASLVLPQDRLNEL